MNIVGRKLSHYRVLRELGSGGMGAVYLAHDEKLGRDVALKTLHAGSITDATRHRFRTEARALSRLDHPNIATLFDFDSESGVDFLVMQYVPGTTLEHVVSEGPIPENEAVRYGVQIAEALEEAHAHGIIHRDIKPSNVAITPQGNIKVLDFGLAKLLLTSTAGPTSASSSQFVMGTPGYIAPEQLLGSMADERTDIFAFGVLLYRIVAGRMPFSASTPQALAMAVLSETAQPIRKINPNVSPRFDALVARCIRKDPTERFAGVRDLLSELRPLSAEPARTDQPVGNRRWVLGSVAGLVIVAMTVVLALVPGVRERLLGRPSTGLIQSLAVLPLENLSADPDQEFFVDGMTDELISTLGQLGALRVISRTSVTRYKTVTKSLPQIGRELSVDAVLEGSILRAGDRVRITTRLVRAATEEPLWSRSYERDLDDVLGLQRDVAQAIAQEIRLQLTPEERAQLERVGSSRPRAQEAYLKARYHAAKLNRESLRASIDYFDQAVAEDPQFAQAYAGKANSFILLTYSGGVTPQFGLAKAKQAAQLALELDPSVGEAHSALGAAEFLLDLDWVGAEEEFKRALAINAGDVSALVGYSRFLSAVGRSREAIEMATRAERIDPLALPTRLNLGIVYFYARRFDQAVEQFELVAEMDSTFAWAHSWLGLSLEQTGQFEHALSAFERAYGTGVNPAAAHTLAASGRRDDARRMLEQLRSGLGEYGPRISRFETALVHTSLGETEKALVHLEQAMRENRADLVTLKVEPALGPLHGTPRFENLLRSLRMPQ